MEQQFRSSFIPKKPITAPVRSARPKPLGVAFVAASMLLIIAAASAGGAFGFEQYLKGQIQERVAALERNRSQLQPELIDELRRADARIQHANTLLREHVAISPVFSLLEESTLFNVQYTGFSYATGPDGSIVLSMAGKAPSFRSLALQARSFEGNQSFSDVVFSEIAVDDTGRVGFKVDLNVAQSVLGYDNWFEDSAASMPMVEIPETSTTTP